ncbi:hypothetical protein BABINDRAFT_164062 [Babjeviella inositovora NRRL Y-12698]|uniref:Coatomer subunit beta n=1 Tax=Babjeviella inositovora NRRL Y-12698 TaxID=984486 RepID=A0A1E3QX73_9ASCO|nr:uncharacterized protein BABINDRAFT_164062 [Babjeviella inositovora NRRL Y-12698]ODQ82250.1 hypothetical protein BABINDRAFT_164062 [Babjeviella inositovora NRRL Y-12698]
MSQPTYTLVFEPNPAAKPSVQEFRTLLEKGSDADKIHTMKRILVTMLNGDLMPDLLMHIIRYVMPSKSKELKKLLYFYWEIVPKTGADGKLKQEMILVCNAIQHDLAHPNEYIRGNTLRFLAKLKQPDLLEPLVPHVRACLDHRHLYVRKNAVFAVYAIYQVSEHLLPDADELIEVFLTEETDATCKRNAFVCLGDLDREKALGFVQQNLQRLAALDAALQLAIVDFIKTDAPRAPALRATYVQIIHALLESASHAVVYDASTVLTGLSSSTVDTATAARNLISLAIKESDNTVKLITLEQVDELRARNAGVLDDAALDILRVLSAPDVGVRRKALDIVMKLVSARNVDDVVKLLKKELQKTVASSDEDTGEYRQVLIGAIHQCAIQFGEVAADVVDLLLEFMGELNTTAASDIITFVKEVVEKFPALRSDIIHKLIRASCGVTSGKVYRSTLWIFGEYCLDEKDIQAAWRHIRAAIGEIPILASEKKVKGETEEVKTESSGPVVLPDGTYASENALTVETKRETAVPALRALILKGDFYTAAVLASTLVKLVLRFQASTANAAVLNALKAEAMLIMVSILRVGESSYVAKKIDEDSAERILAGIRFLTEETNAKFVETVFLEDTKQAFRAQVEAAEAKKAHARAEALHQNAAQVDDAIVFRQFEVTAAATEEIVAADAAEDLSSRLSKLVQLTGFSDPVYAEAYVKVHQFDVVLDVLIVNQTTATLRNLTVEFATLGDLKVVDKPTTLNVGPHGFHRVQATVKVTSADTGVIFGNIIYDGQHANEATTVILNDVHVDIMDYIKPATCTENAFRTMWNEFEWENKITIKSSMASLHEYLDSLMAGTNMACLTPGAVVGECQFLSANLYARSSFGEDALANLCIEKKADGPIVGHVRIRSKGQGLALSMGDRIASISRKANKPKINVV